MIKNFPRDCKPILTLYPYGRSGYQDIFTPSPYGFTQNSVYAEGCFNDGKEFFGYLSTDRKSITIEHWVSPYPLPPFTIPYTFKKRIFKGKRI